MTRDASKLLVPTAVVHAKCLDAALVWKLIKTGLDDAKQCARRGLLQRELDQRLRLTGIIRVRIHRVGVPGEREQPLRLNVPDNRLPSEMLITRMMICPAQPVP